MYASNKLIKKLIPLGNQSAHHPLSGPRPSELPQVYNPLARMRAQAITTSFSTLTTFHFFSLSSYLSLDHPRSSALLYLSSKDELPFSILLSALRAVFALDYVRLLVQGTPVVA